MIRSRAIWLSASAVVVGTAVCAVSPAHAQFEDPEQGAWQPPPPQEQQPQGQGQQPPQDEQGPQGEPQQPAQQGPAGQQPPPTQPAQPAPQQAPSGQAGSGQPAGQQQRGGEWFRKQGREEPPAFAGQDESEASDAPADTDHAAVVGSIGVGFFGVETLSIDPGTTPLGGGMGGDVAPGQTRVRAPTVGIRYWFSNAVGLDVGIGAGLTNYETTNADNKILGGSEGFGLTFHAGLPLALGVMQHFTVELIPEVDVGYGSGTLLAREEANDVSLSGLLLRVGARLGGEVQFGFWDLPQLALQATIGLGLEYESRAAEVGDTEVTNAGFAISSTVQDLFNGTIRAVYYFN